MSLHHVCEYISNIFICVNTKIHSTGHYTSESRVCFTFPQIRNKTEMGAERTPCLYYWTADSVMKNIDHWRNNTEQFLPYSTNLELFYTFIRN